MTELEYLRGRVRLLEGLLAKARRVVELASLYPTLLRNITAALSNASPEEEAQTREESDSL